MTVADQEVQLGEYWARQRQWQGGSTDPGNDGGQDRARLRRARDYLIDVEEELLHVAKRDPSLQTMIDRTVADIMELTRRVE